MTETVTYVFQPPIEPAYAPDDEDGEDFYPAFFPREVVEAGGPDDSVFIGACAWTFSRSSERREGYFVGRPSTTPPYTWVLWRFAFDDNWEAWSWDAYAATTDDLADATEAGRKLLTFGWGEERDRWGLQAPDEVELPGLLTTAQINAMMAEVFGDYRAGDEDDDRGEDDGNRAC